MPITLEVIAEDLLVGCFRCFWGRRIRKPLEIKKTDFWRFMIILVVEVVKMSQVIGSLVDVIRVTPFRGRMMSYWLKNQRIANRPFWGQLVFFGRSQLF